MANDLPASDGEARGVGSSPLAAEQQVAQAAKSLPADAGDAGDWASAAGWGTAPAEGNGTPPQYSFLENPMDRGAWRASAHRVTKSRTWLSNWARSTEGDPDNQAD